MNVVFGVTPNRPSPDWKCILYSYDNRSQKLKLEWVLPQSIEIAKVILAHEEGFDRIMVNSIKKFLKGELQ